MRISSVFSDLQPTIRPLPIFVLGLLSLLPVTVDCAGTGEIAATEGLAIEALSRSGRTALHVDPLEAEIVAGTWRAPKEGDTMQSSRGDEKSWTTVTADEEGWFKDSAMRGGYAYFPVRTKTRRVMLLQANGHGAVYLNGEPRTGDVYGAGKLSLPVLLRKGNNDLLFRCGRGRLRWTLAPPEAPLLLDGRDFTLPDLIVGEESDTWGAVMLLNATEKPMSNLYLRTVSESLSEPITPLAKMNPLSVRKVGFRIAGPPPTATGKADVLLELLHLDGGAYRTLHSLTFELKTTGPKDNQRRTFISEIDGSVQYYAVNPAQPLADDAPAPALFLSPHGASVEAINQANAFSHKTWGHLVAPTNRRPYGFDWEDWGRLDALEVLELNMERLGADPSRVYLTGHSMGGHGTWSLGALFPDRWAAIGPCAGWVSFWSYSRRANEEPENEIEDIMRRATAISDTLSMSRNYAQHAVYIHHGGDDKTVPPREARKMFDHLASFHHDFQYHEQPGAGHWWDDNDAEGAGCVDWAPMFDVFARRAIPSKAMVRDVTFITPNPGVSAWSHWVGIETQQEPHQPSEVQIRCDPWKRRFTGQTENVERIAFTVDHLAPEGELNFELDGVKVENVAYPTAEPVVRFVRDGENWKPVGPLPASHKGPHRNGPFKEAFQHRMQFVYGTVGNRKENAWAFAKARYDAEQFWYRGNGSIDVIADREFDPSREPDRAVILYGNADTNGAWEALLGESPVQVKRGEVRVGERVMRGGDMACLFLRPRRDSDTACVAAVSGSGLPGMRLTDRMPYFRSGTGFPDCLVVGTETLTDTGEGMGGMGGVRAAGFFGNDWSVETGFFASRDSNVPQ